MKQHKHSRIVGILLLLIVLALFISYIPEVFANDRNDIVNIDK